MEVQFNVNEWVKVKLTDIGLNELKRQHDELNERIRKNGGTGFDEFPYKPDKEGYYRFQLHYLMFKLGHLMKLGYSSPFEMDIILINARPID